MDNNVITSKNNLERENQSLKSLISQSKIKKTFKGEVTVKRWNLEEIRPGYFHTPTTVDEIKTAY